MTIYVLTERTGRVNYRPRSVDFLRNLVGATAILFFSFPSFSFPYLPLTFPFPYLSILNIHCPHPNPAMVCEHYKLPHLGQEWRPGRQRTCSLGLEIAADGDVFLS